MKKETDLETASSECKQWKEAGYYFQHRNHNIFCIESPSGGEAILLIHGFPTSSYDFKFIWKELSEKYRLVACDMIGYGFSDKPKEYEYSIFDQADLQEELISRLGIKKLHLLVHDYGVTVTQEILARQQERKVEGKLTYQILSVCFLNGGIFPEKHRPRPIQNMLLSPIGPIIAYLLSEGSFSRAFGAVFGDATQPTPREMHDFWEIVRFNQGNRIYHKLIRYMTERKQNRMRWVGSILNSEIPLRLINGADDPVSGRHVAEHYAKLINNPDIVVLEHIGHYPHVEAPLKVLRHYGEFLDKVKKESKK